MNGLGPITQLNAPRRARVANSKAPWDELRAVFKIVTDKKPDEFKALVAQCTHWPNGWRPTITTTNPHQGKMYAKVYFALDAPPQEQAGAFVRATLSLLA